jgi:hypothetical protein
VGCGEGELELGAGGGKLRAALLPVERAIGACLELGCGFRVGVGGGGGEGGAGRLDERGRAPWRVRRVASVRDCVAVASDASARVCFAESARSARVSSATVSRSFSRVSSGFAVDEEEKPEQNTELGAPDCSDAEEDGAGLSRRTPSSARRSVFSPSSCAMRAVYAEVSSACRWRFIDAVWASFCNEDVPDAAVRHTLDSTHLNQIRHTS